MNKALNIIVVDDDEVFSASLAISFGKKGHAVQCFTTIETVIADIPNLAPLDLLLLDLKLEKGTSLGSIKHLRELVGPHTKIIMMTGFASIATTVEAMKSGADDYLPKPISTLDILSAYYGERAELEDNDAVMSPKRIEWEHIQRVLAENDGNISRTAKQLNMHRRTLQRKLQKKPQQ